MDSGQAPLICFGDSLVQFPSRHDIGLTARDSSSPSLKGHYSERYLGMADAGCALPADVATTTNCSHCAFALARAPEVGTKSVVFEEWCLLGCYAVWLL
jgi:hypothetical protein